VRQVVSVRYQKYIRRPILAFLRMPGAGGFGTLLLLFAIIVSCSILDLYLTYENPQTGDRLDFVAAVYAVFALLVFETPLDLPASWITRLVFFAVPISGILVLGQGLVRLGSSLLDKNTWDQAMASTYKDHAIVCGLGRVGLKVTRWLLDLNEEVVVIESNPNGSYIAEVRDWGVPVVIADARRANVLESVNIKEAEAIVPCTSDDLTNLGIALEARRLVPKLKVVLRLFDAHIAENIRHGFDIRTTFSIPDISAPTFAAAATRAPLDHAITFGDGEEQSLLTITKFTLIPESSLVGYTVRQLEDEFDVAVIAHRHEGKFMLHPRDDAILCAGDRFVASASIPALNQLARYTPPTREYERYLQGRWPLRQKK
jgi:Trk K+ transport system NAD-binding subunit